MGTVIEHQSRQPLGDVVVTATSPNLVGEKTVVTDAQGSYRIPQLPPGVYTLRFERQHYKLHIRADVQLRLDRTVRVNVELAPEPPGELIEFIGPPSTRGPSSTTTGIPVAPERIGAPPTIDVGSTTTGISVDSEFIRRIAASMQPGGKPMYYESLAALGPRARHHSYGVSLHHSTAPESGYVVEGLASEWAYGLDDVSPSMARLILTQGIYSSVPPMQPFRAIEPVYVPPGSATQPARQPRPLMPINGARFFDMYFKGFGVNPTVNTAEEPFSTFSVDTDTASYSVTRAYLERSSLPDEAAVRVEEFVNRFTYDYPSPDDAPFGVHVEGFPSPVRKGYQVVRIGVKAQEVARGERKPSHLVFVIDTSGSMQGEERLGLVKRALRLLVEALDERDRVSIVAYGSDARQVLPPTRLADKQRLLAAINRLDISGSTNAQAGMELGYRIASEHLVPGGINRVILCSDGVANNGITSADGIWRRVKEYAARGITLSTVGFGMGNYNDVLMERLAQVGEGNYAYVDKLKEAERIFVENLDGTLQVVAKDVKLQVEFDAESVSFYRLIGYENRALTKAQFRDDAVDAGEVGARHSVTALYEVKLREPSTKPLGTLRIRFKAPEGGRSSELELPLARARLRPAFMKASPSTRLAYVAAAFAEKLRGSYWVRPLTYDTLEELWSDVGTPIAEREEVAELGALIRKAHDLDQREDRFEAFAPLASMDFDHPPPVPSEPKSDATSTPTGPQPTHP
ncbi:von Willebrand factor type A domain-containing protein [Myxococcus stipitatus]|uniref:YfbK domain-containing protein n=1 Tax=Myxococcus stipitatus TaxID=83455 RepID=UPI001F1B37DE|nr:von Willebrand factor type A domain-containing protein [Myxococcus stipitatus]MCE9668364.1 von Willebrand factor type A domain-containing protein [Myxococcus stipitatus]